MTKQPIVLLENTRDWPKGVQEDVDFIASLDGDDGSISTDDLLMVPNTLCNFGTSNTLVGKIICDGNDNWTMDSLWRAVSMIELLKTEFSATNKVHWHLGEEAKLVGEDKTKQAYEILKEIKQRYLERLAKTPDISDQEKVELVYQVLQETGFILKAQDEKSLFTDNLIGKMLDCDTSSFVVRALAEEFGWPVRLITVPEHIFVRWDSEKEVFNIDYGNIRTDDYYRKEFYVEGNLSKYETPYEASVYMTLGVVKERNGDFDGAFAAHNESLKINRRDATVWLNLGVVRGKKNDWDGAIEAFNIALNINPMFANAWEKLGTAKWFKNDSNGAFEALKKALEIDPLNADAWNNLGVIMWKMGNLDGAITACEALLVINPRDANVWLRMGDAKKKKGDLIGAEKAFQEARKLDPSL